MVSGEIRDAYQEKPAWRRSDGLEMLCCGCVCGYRGLETLTMRKLAELLDAAPRRFRLARPSHAITNFKCPSTKLILHEQHWQPRDGAFAIGLRTETPRPSDRYPYGEHP